MTKPAVSACPPEPAEGGASRQGRRTAWLSPVNAVIAVAALVALGLQVYWLSRPGHLLGVTQYDDGPYFGSAVRLVYGVLPYRGFVLVQPPGITLLMAPAALLSKVIGTAWGMATGRMLTAAAAAAAVMLAGLLVRHRGTLAVLVTCGILAVYPDSVLAAHTVLVEPWLVLFCLIGALVLFSGDRLAGTRRLAWGGCAFGFAGAVEPWAIVPVIVVFVLCLPQPRRAAAFTAGVAAGFAIPVLPFAALAPRQFYQSLVVAQIGSRARAPRVGLWVRLQNMVGIPQALGHIHLAILVAALIIVVAIAATMIASAVATRSLPPPLDCFAVLTAALAAAIFLWPPQFHYHFAAFLAPFLAMAIALPASRFLAAVQPAGPAPWLSWWVTGLAGLALTAMAAFQVHLANTSRYILAPDLAAAERVIPPGACVLSDQVSDLLLANRFVSDMPGCPQVVDGLGTDLVLSHGLTPGTGAGQVPAVAALWRDALHRAQYVLLSSRNGRRIAWTPALRSYFRDTFTRVLAEKDCTVYAREPQPSSQQNAHPTDGNKTD